MRTLDAEEKITLRSTELPDAISAIFEASCDDLIRWCSFSLSEQITVAVRFPQVHFAFIYDRQMNDKECIITKSHAYLKLGNNFATKLFWGIVKLPFRYKVYSDTVHHGSWLHKRVHKYL